MDSFKYCRCCLATEIKLFSFDSKVFGKELREIYSQMLQIPVTYEDNHMCFECSALLYKYTKFKDKCLKAHLILSDYINSEIQLSRNIIKEIDREKNKLKTNYTCSDVVFYVDNLTDSVNHSNKINIVTKQELEEESEIKSESSSNSNKVTANLDGVRHYSSEDDNALIVANVKKNIKSGKQPIKRGRPRKGKPSAIIKKKILNKSIKEKLKMPRREKIKAESGGFNDINNSSEPGSIEWSSFIEIDIKEIKDKPNKKKRKVFTALKKEGDTNTLAKRKQKLKSKKMSEERKIANSNLNYVKNHVDIIVLSKEDAEKEFLQRKNSSNYNNCPFKCEYCFKGFLSKNTFENHIQKHKEDYGPHKCEICHLRYNTKPSLSSHIRTSHKMRFICKSCPYSSTILAKVKNHVKFHKGVRYPCKLCGLVFDVPNSLASHLRYKHDNQFDCEFCGETFYLESGLVMHKRRRHWKEKNEKEGPKCEDCDIHFANETAWKRHLVLSPKHKISNGCDECGETFSHTNELKIHKDIKHMDSKRCYKQFPRVCSMCDQVLTTYDEYKTHVTSDHPETLACAETVGPLICKVCGKDFKDKHIDYNMHILTEHSRPLSAKMSNEDSIDININCKPYMCEICGETFKSPCHLGYHQRKHTGELPYKCTECGKCFAFSPSLSAHRLTHKKSLFQCDICSKTFKAKSALCKHVKVVHLKLRPYKCTHCEIAFPTPCEVKYHFKHVHCKVPWPKRDRSKRTRKPQEGWPQ